MRLIDDLTLAATASVPVAASLSATLADLTLSAAGAAVINASLAATLDPITLNATGSLVAVVVPPARRGGGASPWWWPAYVRRHEDEREAGRLKWRDEHTIEGDVWAVLPMPTAHGEFLHDPDEADLAALAAASLWLLAA